MSSAEDGIDNNGMVGPQENNFAAILTRFGVDILAGGTAGALVTPIISAVDKALAENASGKAKLWPSFFATMREVGRSPLTFVRGPSFFYIWLIYGGTYVAANAVETTCALKKTEPAAAKWVATSLTNTATCIMKDRAFAQMFGTSVPANVPPAAYAAWLSRDFVSMGVFFTMPPIIGKQLAPIMGSEDSGYYAAQIGLPLILQTITTPLHLLGYDIYNKPKASVGDRIKFMQKDYWKNVSIRMVRMAPPWSFGTIGNREMRSRLLDTMGMAPIGGSLVYHVSG
jgi:hypothetical protein